MGQLDRILRRLVSQARPCTGDFKPQVALPRFQIPPAFLRLAALLMGLSFRGPKAVSRRQVRLVQSTAAVLCIVLAFVWM
jgi:hypothetical protein